jgi:nucleotide-binding universal stress UspA family protein
MFKTIVWASDGSEQADGALPYAKALAQQQKTTLIIVHVIEKYVSEKPSALSVYADEEQVTEKLNKLVARISDEGVTTDLKIVTHVGPQPAHTIADVAREAGAGLIVVGTRGHGAVVGLVLGSVTQRLLHVSPCPVLVIPPHEQPAPAPTP